MKAVILAAGRGTRMGGMTTVCPKPMVVLKGKPKLAYTLDLLPDVVDEVILVVGYLGACIHDYFGDSYGGRPISYVKQEELNGTSGAIMLVQELVGDEKFLVLMGDDLYMREDLEKVVAYDYALLAFETNNAQPFGLVDVDADNHLVRVVERPHDHVRGLVNTAAYTLSPAYFSYPPVAISETEYGLPQTLVTMKNEHDITVVTTQIWQPVGTPEDVSAAEDFINRFCKTPV